MKKSRAYLTLGSIFLVLLIAFIPSIISEEQSGKPDAESLNLMLGDFQINPALSILGLPIWFKDINYDNNDKVSDFVYGFKNEGNIEFVQCKVNDKYVDVLDVENRSGLILVFEDEGTFSGIVSSEIKDNQPPEDYYAVAGVLNPMYYSPYIEKGSPWEAYQTASPQNLETARALFLGSFE